MANDTMISQHAADDALVATIALFMGRGRRWSVKDVEIGTGISERTLSAMIALDPESRRAPSGRNLLLLMSFFGVEFTDRLLSHVGQGARDLNPAPDAPGVVIAGIMSAAAEFARAGADNQFCSRDRRELRDDAVTLIQLVEPFARPAND